MFAPGRQFTHLPARQRIGALATAASCLFVFSASVLDKAVCRRSKPSSQMPTLKFLRRRSYRSSCTVGSGRRHECPVETGPIQHLVVALCSRGMTAAKPTEASTTRETNASFGNFEGRPSQCANLAKLCVSDVLVASRISATPCATERSHSSSKILSTDRFSRWHAHRESKRVGRRSLRTPHSVLRYSTRARRSCSVMLAVP